LKNLKFSYLSIKIILILAILLLSDIMMQNGHALNSEMGRPDESLKNEKSVITFNQIEKSYLKNLNKVKMCVDPDWEPYEHISKKGIHEGIAADIVNLIAERTGVSIELLPSKNWEESIENSKTGKCQIISFLNKTRKREKWLIFTEPYFSDPNVIITREEYRFISNPSTLSNVTMVLPGGTSIEERIRKDYPDFKIITVKSEAEVFDMVSERKADMTVRSLTMAAYTIKKEGMFNLKIAGQIPDYFNEFRIGVKKDQPILRDILNKGIMSITPKEIQQIVNRHISINVQTAVDYALIFRIITAFAFVSIIGFLWIYQLRKLNYKLKLRESELVILSNKLSQDVANRIIAEDKIKHLLAEKEIILKEVHHRIKNNMNTIKGLLFLQAESLKDKTAVSALNDAQSRVESMMVLYDKLYLSEGFGKLSIKEYLPVLLDEIIENFPNKEIVEIEKNIEDFTLDANTIFSLGIIVNELITNIMKYAFIGKTSGVVIISAFIKGNIVTLIIQDDGIGMPESISFENSTGFGMQLVSMLIQQIGGNICIERNHGTKFMLEFSV